jgi:phthiocerol/phenolphthiocerol synthesis type-I polyketide synthase E
MNTLPDLGAHHEEVAIVGMAGRFPGANDIDAFWANLRDGVESIRPFTREELAAAGVAEKALADPRFVNAGAVLEDGDRFDAAFFGIGKREAEIMDPQHRICLEVAWEAFEDAGYNPESFPGLIGVFGGVARNTYFQKNLITRPDLVELMGRYAIMLGNEKEYAITRISYSFDLRGPSLSVNTACSSTGVATHLACQSLLSGECDMALVGGGRIRVPLTAGYTYEQGGILSPDGHCRAFDASAQGTVAGSGVAMIVLKRLSEAIRDGDCIHAVIKGSAINNDGSQKVGFTAPGIQGQVAVIQDALLVAGVHPESVGYVEAHGTGTKLGDPIEVSALTMAYRSWTEKEGYCPIGSVKPNIGHLDAGAGVAGIIKTALSLEHQQIPPSINYTEPNPQIDFAHSPFYVNAELSAWPRGETPRRAGVSSFGLGGTNAHILLEEAPERGASGKGRSQHLLLLSAKSAGALGRASERLTEHLRRHPDHNLADLAYTLQVGRKSFFHRQALVCHDVNEVIGGLNGTAPHLIRRAVAPSVPPRIAFMFSGQGAQYVNMGLELYEREREFRQEIRRCAEILSAVAHIDLISLLYPQDGDRERASETLRQTAFTQPALFAYEYSLAAQWMSWGITPYAMVGHSIGEYVAACLAGVFSLKDALSVVSSRGELMQDLPPGGMLAVPLSEQGVRELLDGRATISVVNAPELCVLSGTQDEISELASQLNGRGIQTTVLHTSHAFHSPMMEPMLPLYAERLRDVELHEPQIPFLSNVTGTWITPDEATDPDYWVRQIRQPVRFSDCIGVLLEEDRVALLEVGPGRTLTSLVKANPGATRDHVVLASSRHPKERRSDLAALLEALGGLWLAGVHIDWSRYYQDERRQRLSLPTYPFERTKYWVDPAGVTYSPTVPSALPTETAAGPAPAEEPTKRGEDKFDGMPRTDTELRLADLWRNLLGIERVTVHDNFFEIGGSSLLASRMFTQIADVLGSALPLSTIFEAPTIRRLAALVEGSDLSTNVTSIVKIRKSGHRKPLLCIPGNLGNVFADLRYLSRHLGDEQPVYGFQDGLGHPWRVERLASHYIEDIRNEGLEGPYSLAGICSGGVVAFEIANQLARQGDQVDFLGLIEPASLPLPGARSYFDVLREIWFRFSHHVGDHSRTMSKLNLRERLMFLRLRLKLIANLFGMKQYLPRKYPGRLHIYLTKESIDSSPRPAWGGMAKGGASIYQIPGNHRRITGDYTDIEENDMRVLAGMLRRHIDAGRRNARERDR